MVTRILTLLAAVILALGPAPAPAFDGEKALHEAAKKEKEFTWYTAHYNSETAAAICQGFEKKYPGVKCNYIRTTAQVAYQRLAQDQKAGIAQASVISSTDQSHYTKMKQDGWLQPYKPKNLSELVDGLPPFNDPDDLFVATAAGLVLLTYNTSVVAAVGGAQEVDGPRRSQVEGQGLHRPPRLQRLRGHLGGADEEALRLGLLQEARAEQAAHRPLHQRHRDHAERQGEHRGRGPVRHHAREQGQGQPARRRLSGGRRRPHGLRLRHPQERAGAQRGQALHGVPARAARATR